MPTVTTPPDHAHASVTVIGAGRLGSALTAALRAAGLDVEGPLGRGARSNAGVTVLCVPDGEIAAAAEAAQAPGFVGHTSGATPLAVLGDAGERAFGLHPLQTFAGGESAASFSGAGCAVAGASPEALAVARDLATRLGMLAIEIDDSERAAYHAAASVASNFLVTLQAVAEELAGAAGLTREQARSLLAPLVRSTVDNWAERGPEAALTGPVARGDDATVIRQRDAVEGAAPHLLPLFDELVERTRAVAAVGDGVPA